MKKWTAALLIPVLCLAGKPSSATGDKTADPAGVVPIRWEKLDRSPLADTLSGRIRQILLNANKYALNKWYGPVKGFAAQSGAYLDFGGIREHDIRPAAHEAFALAVSLQFEVYDPALTGASRQEAVERTVRLVSSLAARHRSHAGKGGWGHEWQSALWASQAATAGWLMWGELQAGDRERVRAMTVSEADRLIDYIVPYYKDRDGNVLFKGDSKAEENAWNSTILVIATAMMPTHPHWQKWFDKAV